MPTGWVMSHGSPVERVRPRGHEIEIILPRLGKLLAGQTVNAV